MQKPSGTALDAPPKLHRLDWPRDGFWKISRRVAYAAAEAFLSDRDEAGRLIPGPEGACARAVRALGHSVGRTGTDLRRGYNFVLVLLELLPLFVLGTPSRMSRLPLEQRVAYFEALEASNNGLLAMMLIAIKVPLCMPAFEEGDELALTGFDRPSTTSRRRLDTISTKLSVNSKELHSTPAHTLEENA